ncbi:MAG: tRNA (adenosine(37)-N6)-dimethylallyltransferase MiaA, partial [Elusimicrobia bacterium]|nr:tRNA (adenosine(37)-N6)-dimethylallyltransferase MiaA [Elusimicrobiota bacterium]
RIVRALEVYQLTGKPLSWWHQLEQGSEISRPSIHSVTTPSPCLIGLRWDRRQLATRITARTHWMLTHGMIEETNALLDEGVPPEAPVFEGLGYRHIVAYLHGTLTREALEPLIVRDTVQYAKRQMTWFRKEPGIRWLDVQEPFDAHAMAQRCLELGKRSWG